MFKRIVVPLDGSRLSAQALPFAAQLARQFCSEIILLRIVFNTSNRYASRASVTAVTPTTDIVSNHVTCKDVVNTANAKRYLMNRAKELSEQNLNVSCCVREGLPANSIIDFSMEHNASLVILMSHGRGRFKGKPIGSVTDSLVRNGIVPVLVIRARDSGK